LTTTLDYVLLELEILTRKHPKNVTAAGVRK
jgi:hypothetical protein